jgi:hypothetical protein
MKTVPQRIHKIIQHINHVRDNCLILGEKLIASGKSDMGRLLIANGFIHDNSKFYGVEWDFLSEDIENVDKLKIAISQQAELTSIILSIGVVLKICQSCILLRWCVIGRLALVNSVHQFISGLLMCH